MPVHSLLYAVRAMNTVRQQISTDSRNQLIYFVCFTLSIICLHFSFISSSASDVTSGFV